MQTKYVDQEVIRLNTWHDLRWPGIVWWAGLWLAAAGLLLVLVGSRVDLSRANTALTSAPGQVISKDPGSHALVRAEFTVDGVRYVASDSFIGPPNPRFDDIHVGDEVTIIYDPAAPDRAVLHQPESISLGLAVFGIIALLIVPTLFTAFVYLAFRSRGLLSRKVESPSARRSQTP